MPLFRLITGVILIGSTTNVQALDLIHPRLVTADKTTTLIHVAIIDAENVDRDTLTIDLASAWDFKKAGISLNRNNETLLTEIVMDDSGSSFVKIWTNRALDSAHLDFVLRASWKGGNVVRPFSVVLREETTISSQQPARAAISSRDKQLVTDTPQTSTSATNGIASTAENTLSALNKRKAGVTLWHVASIIQQTEAATTNQVMLAFLRKNPDAFVRNNINLLKKGSVLRSPSSEEIHATNARNATQEIKSHEKSWNEWKSDRRAQLDGSKPSIKPMTAQTKGSLRLSNGDQALPSPGLQSVLTVLEQQQRNYQQLLNEALTAATTNGDKQTLNNNFGKVDQLVADLKQTVELKNTMLAYMQTRNSSEANTATTNDATESRELTSALAAATKTQLVKQQPSVIEQLEQEQQKLTELAEKLDSTGSSNIRLVIISTIAILVAFVLIGSGLILMFRRKQQQLEQDTTDAIALADKNAEVKAKAILQELFDDDKKPLDETLRSLRKLLETNEDVFATQNTQKPEPNNEFDPFDAMDFDSEFASIDQMFGDVAENKDDDESTIIWQPALADSSSASWQVKTINDGDSSITEVDGTSELIEVPATPIELAKAYLELDDQDGAKKMLQVAIKQGNESEQQAAKELLEDLS